MKDVAAGSGPAARGRSGRPGRSGCFPCRIDRVGTRARVSGRPKQGYRMARGGLQRGGRGAIKGVERSRGSRADFSFLSPLSAGCDGNSRLRTSQPRGWP
jgi:hypothetical protein